MLVWCEKCGSVHSFDDKGFLTLKQVGTKLDVHRSAEENLQRYLNANKVNPNHIISISSGAYSTNYGGYMVITLVHY